MKFRLLQHVIMSLCFLLLFTNTQCDEDGDAVSSCGPAAVIDPGFFETAETRGFKVTNAEVLDSCLTVDFSASGCDGSTWSLVLVDSGEVAESNPEQRSLKLVFGNDETCLAVINQTRMFNLSNLRIEDSSSIQLNIEGVQEPLIYDY